MLTERQWESPTLTHANTEVVNLIGIITSLLVRSHILIRNFMCGEAVHPNIVVE